MKRYTDILWITSDGCRLGLLREGTIAWHDLDADANDTVEFAAALQRIAAEQPIAGTVLIALPSAWCYSASIPLEGLPRRHRRQAMLYRLEAKLPLAAEQLTVDWLTSRTTALGIAIETDRLRPLVDALGEAGWTATAALPAALLIYQQLRAGLEAEDQLVAFSFGQRLELFEWTQQYLTGWWSPATTESAEDAASSSPPGDDTEPSDAPATSTEPSAQAIAEHWMVRSVQARHETGLPLRTIAFEEDEERDEPEAFNLDELIAAGVRRIRDGREAPIVDLRPAASAKGQAQSRGGALKPRGPYSGGVAAAAILLLVAVSGALLWRANQYGQLADDLGRRQAAVYRELHPEEKNPPTSIVTRLAAEARALQIQRDGVDPATEPTPLLNVLRDTLKHLPTGLRYRLTQMRIDGGKVDLDGEARSHSDADRIAGSLREHAAFRVDPPRTEQLRERGVSFRLHASYTASPPEPPAPPAPPKPPVTPETPGTSRRSASRDITGSVPQRAPAPDRTAVAETPEGSADRAIARERSR